jgi:hypothetical protein
MSSYSFPYLSPHQSRTREPTEWEMSLADALESAFSKGSRDLPSLVAALNASRIRPLGGGHWTEAGFSALMQELGA